MKSQVDGKAEESRVNYETIVSGAAPTTVNKSESN
jgi:hypothetical protein